MLEFQDGFFDQEIREGFYVDTTMKTVWAAELEVLQRVAEICDKYGIKWYAAYGSLLGAIRHEGFVPWDDDMDIWMMREDYNKMMKILPKELPEGYRVRGPLTDEGYDQYHTCINSGSGICITDEWLETYHGCPFTVGLDIFPLDYLPRDENERKIQKGLFILAGRVAQLAKNIARGDFDREDSERTIDEVVVEINDGIDYLEDACKFNINRRLVEEKEWNELASEMWKYGNYIAMMYTESESDFVVEYLDYVRWSFKKYPKEWFSEVYGATFENFMLMIPSGYEHILYTTYRDYYFYTPNTGFHEYPYYARQLRQLREYVKNIEDKANQYGLVPLNEINVEENLDIPDEWKNYLLSKDGTIKKIVLSANNPQYYVRMGKNAIEKLKKTLLYFRNNKDSVLLWWRPHPLMKKILDQYDKNLGDEYQRILEKYKSEAWGICDDTDNYERAADKCHAYYGEMNAVVQSVQNASKPIMLVEMDEMEAEKYNDDRKRQYRSFINYTEICSIGGKEYFANTNFNALLVRDKSTKEIELIQRFNGKLSTEKNLHISCVARDNKILFLPVGKGGVHIFNADTSELKEVLITEEGILEESWSYHKYGKDIYLLSNSINAGIWKWNVDDDSFVKQEWWQPYFGEGVIQHGVISDEKFFSYEKKANKMCITDLKNQRVDEFTFKWGAFSLLRFDGIDFYFSVCGSKDVGRWDPMKGLTRVYEPLFNEEFSPERDETFYGGMECSERGIFLIPHLGNKVYFMDKESGNCECIFSADFEPLAYLSEERTMYFKRMNNQIICSFRNIDISYEINLDTNSVSIIDKKISLNEYWNLYIYRDLIDKNALLFEEMNKCDLDFFIQNLKSK